ncbi:MarR family winged helix-turn-helix transcriptional regulator [Arthrobacter bambusae]|uniref:MarR family winged helix-turn-helix transcriptional regulator n=1 Tax=Arthrobacter bambusae TaxID=1338426 RepID=UPI0027855B6C|nr:MarR family transcriptional regulator [Arthrobacter bambusae]MDQ0030913.1 DNA-binding MarR family transcriptional regulator [Arthrobacter bambusae]MDQ0099278.1 DNA-binding MarR family transcriptional regulator [Arthrobacter bambusae]
MDARKVRGGYWYGSDGADPGPIDLLNALRDYRASEAAMRRRTRTSMGMGETDLLALRYLLEAEHQGRSVSPKELAAWLGVTSASTTALIDRLVASGNVRREPHPSDRRALILRPTPGSDQEVRSTLGGMHSRMIDVARSFDAGETKVIIDFLRRMQTAVDTIDE